MSTEEEIRVMPHALGPEKSVLSSFMKVNGLIEEVPLNPEIFYLPAHQKLYRLLSAEGEFEFVSFTNRLHQKGELEDIGGPAAMTDLYTYAPTQAHFQRHLEILRHCHARRLAIRACVAAVEAAHDMSEGEDSGNYLRSLSGPLTEVFDTAASIRPERDTKALAKEFLETFEKKVDGRELPIGILTGLSEVDAMLRGIQRQHMGIISARSGGGKSTLATQIAANIATDGTPVLYLILERTELSAFQRAVIQTARVHHGAVTDPRGYAQMQGQTKPDHLTLVSIRRALESLVSTGKLHIRKPQNRRLSTQLAEIRRYVRLHGVQVVFVDQIGLVRGERQKGDSDEVERRGVSNALQEIAHELNIAITVLSQVTEEGDTKGARAVEEDADWWLSIIQERDRKKDNFGEHQHILIAKDSHNGKAGERLPLVLDHETLRFVHGFPKPKEEKKAAGRRSFTNQ